MQDECGMWCVNFGILTCISACISVCISVGCVVVASEGTETRLQEKEVSVLKIHRFISHIYPLLLGTCTFLFIREVKVTHRLLQKLCLMSKKC